MSFLDDIFDLNGDGVADFSEILTGFLIMNELLREKQDNDNAAFSDESDWLE